MKYCWSVLSLKVTFKDISIIIAYCSRIILLKVGIRYLLGIIIYLLVLFVCSVRVFVGRRDKVSLLFLHNQESKYVKFHRYSGILKARQSCFLIDNFISMDTEIISTNLYLTANDIIDTQLYLFTNLEKYLLIP